MSAAWLIEALIASSLLMAFVLLVRRPAQRAFGAQLAYWLWALPALRMATPPLPTAWREHVTAPVAAASETVLVFIAPGSADPAVAPFPWLAFVAACWTAGALGFFAWHGVAHFAYVRRIVAPPAQHERVADGTTLVESEEAIGPVAFGVLRRFVAVPSDFADRYDADERRLALAHELGHHARGDLIANWIALAVLAVHWFNPLAWIAYRKFRADQELANDARVLASLRPVERHAYACAILKAAHGRAITAACHLHTIEDLKGRLRMLKATRKSRAVLVAGATGIAALTLGGLGLTASSVAAEQLRTVAAVQAPRLVAEVAAVAPVANPEQRRTHKIVVVRDGRTERYEGAAADAYLRAHPDMTPPVPPTPPAPAAPGIAPVPPSPPAPPAPDAADWQGPDAEAFASLRDMPTITSRRCAGDTAKQMVIHKRAGRREITVICTNRIEAAARQGAEIAANSEQIQRSARASALTGLRNARATVATSVPSEHRGEALAAIDESIAELESETAAN